MNTSTFTVYLRPYWDDASNTTLSISFSANSGCTFSAKITGPGISSPGVNFSNNETGCVNTNFPASMYERGFKLEYTVAITTNAQTLSGTPVNSLEIGTQQDGTVISYQSFLFMNDGIDQNWNDCVLNFSLFTNSNN